LTKGHIAGVDFSWENFNATLDCVIHGGG